MHRKYSVFLCYGRCDMSHKVAGGGRCGAGGGWVRQHVRYLNCLYHEAVRCVSSPSPSPRQLAGRRVATGCPILLGPLYFCYFLGF